MAQFLRPLSLSVKIVRRFVQATRNPKAAIMAGVALTLIDSGNLKHFTGNLVIDVLVISVSGIGSGSAWYVAYKQET